MDCRKLSVDACMHAVQNDRLPMRLVVQILFLEQVRATASSGSSTPDLSRVIKDHGGHGTSRSNTMNTEDWDALATAEEIKSLREEIKSLRLAQNGGSLRNGDNRTIDRAAFGKVKRLLSSKRLLTKLWSSKGGQSENSGSDSSDSANPEDGKSTPSRNRRRSVS